MIFEFRTLINLESLCLKLQAKTVLISVKALCCGIKNYQIFQLKVTNKLNTQITCLNALSE